MFVMLIIKNNLKLHFKMNSKPKLLQFVLPYLLQEKGLRNFQNFQEPNKSSQ